MRLITKRHDENCRSESLLVMLPAAETKLEDFVDQGFISAFRCASQPADILLAEVTYQHVMEKQVVTQLHEHVIAPALATGYKHIWLMGISLGGFNALHYAAEYARHLAGLFLISPYPGTGDILAEIRANGGPHEWSKTENSFKGDERSWWRWLCMESCKNLWDIPVYLSTGRDDRFIYGQEMIADLLPEDRVRILPGRHDWNTWQAIWLDWLTDGPHAKLPNRKDATV